MPFQPSDLIDGRYRLDRLLGTGGMAEVWLAEDQRLGRWVAVKLLHEAATRQDDLFGSLEREARLVARLSHPNIVSVYDVGVHEASHYLVMEYVHGLSIRQLLVAQGRFTEEEAVRLGAQVASALQYAHDQGVVHCDVKPENVLVNEQGEAKVTDFGVAETVARTVSAEEAREILGTIAYLAPEVIQGAPSDARADVYSLGLTIYEMVAGRLPFTGTTPAAVAGQRLATPAPLLRTLALSASPALEAVLARALALGLLDRYQTAAALRAALLAAPGGRPPPGVAQVTAPVRTMQPRPAPATLVRRGPPPRRPATGANTGLIVAVTAAVVAAIGAAVVLALVLTGGDPGSSPPPTATASPRPSPSPGATETASPTRSATPTPSRTPGATATATRSPTAAPSPTATPTRTPTTAPSPSPSPAATASPTP